MRRHNSHHNHGSYSSLALANLDMYRKVPLDLLEGSRQGSIISWMALILMTLLVFFETKDYLWTKALVSDLALDRSGFSSASSNSNSLAIELGMGGLQHQKLILVNFNVTMMDLPCDFAEINVVSFLGKQQNVRKNVQKFAVDAQGVQQEWMHRNRHQDDIRMSDPKVTQTIEELHANGEHATSVDAETLPYALAEHEFVFVDFFAGWCSHCREFAPTWEAMAEVIYDAATNHIHKDDYTPEAYEYAKSEVKQPAFIAKVDCVAHHVLCMEHGIMGYPTIRLFIHGKVYGDYMGHRDVYNLLMYLKIAEESVKEPNHLSMVEEIARHRLEMTDAERQWAEKTARDHHAIAKTWDPKAHPGCQISGKLLMDKTPGHFYIQAQSAHHEFSPFMTNVSHVIHHLSFGDDNIHTHMDVTPPNFASSTHPLNGNAYVTSDLHQAYHHYFKLVSTNLFSYQVMASSQLAQYRTDQVPEAKFILDLSPIAVTYRWKTRQWYDYITSLMAILGGTFTVVGMVEAGLRAATASRRKQNTTSSSTTATNNIIHPSNNDTVFHPNITTSGTRTPTTSTNNTLKNRAALPLPPPNRRYHVTNTTNIINNNNNS